MFSICVDQVLNVKVLKVKGVYSSSLTGQELLGVRCHMGSHGVTCHPTKVSVPRLNPSQTGWCSVYLPRRDVRLSWARWLFTCQDDLPVCRQSPIQVVSRSVEQLVWSRPMGNHDTTPPPLTVTKLNFTSEPSLQQVNLTAEVCQTFKKSR